MPPARRCTVIAHRGASGTSPENTLVAFRRAADLGAQMVELDVQLTADGEVIVLHDFTLERTTTGSGPVAAVRYAELRRLDAGRWFGPEFAGERVPTLAEVLASIALPVNVELKPVGDDGLAARALEVVDRAGALDRVVFSSFDYEVLETLRGVAPHARLAVLSDEAPIEVLIQMAEGVSARALHLRKEIVSAAGIEQARGAGLAVRAWTVNAQADFERLRDAGVDAIFTDFPERFLQIAPSSDARPGTALPTDLD